jgi:hypothetical protein
MFSKPVLQRVKEGLGENLLKLFFEKKADDRRNNGSELILTEFVNKALMALVEEKPISRKFVLTVNGSASAQYPLSVLSVNTVWLNGVPLKKGTGLPVTDETECYIDASARRIHFGPGRNGTIELNCFIVPREEDLPPEARRALVFHVKAQCCKFIANRLLQDPSFGRRDLKAPLNNPAHWERQGAILLRCFSQIVLRAQS